MRKLFSAALVMIALTGLAACGKKGDVKPPAGYSSTSDQQG